VYEESIFLAVGVARKEWPEEVTLGATVSGVVYFIHIELL
jgi:hypothetical protein